MSILLLFKIPKTWQETYTPDDDDGAGDKQWWWCPRGGDGGSEIRRCLLSQSNLTRTLHTCTLHTAHTLAVQNAVQCAECLQLARGKLLSASVPHLQLCKLSPSANKVQVKKCQVNILNCGSEIQVCLSDSVSARGSGAGEIISMYSTFFAEY